MTTEAMATCCGRQAELHEASDRPTRTTQCDQTKVRRRPSCEEVDWDTCAVHRRLSTMTTGTSIGSQ